MEISRRSVVKGAAWAIPAVATAGAVTAADASAATPAQWAAAHPRGIDFCVYAQYKYGAVPTYRSYLPQYRGSIMNIQRQLGLTRDGSYGVRTRASVIAFQRRNGLYADGIVGSVTARRLGLRDVSSCE